MGGYSLLEKMLFIRTVEQEIAARYPEGRMRTPVHLSIGQEAAAVGVCSALTPDDQIVSTHRSHAHYLAAGGDLNAMIAELYGKGSGCSGGWGGSMHLVDRRVGFMGSTSIVGGTVPIGVGLAWAKKRRKEPGLVVVFHGDAAMETGVWHESVNFAALHKLPVLFVCENNEFSCFTHISERQPKRYLTQLAHGHGLNLMADSGFDPVGISEKTKFFRRSVCKDGPVFFEIATCRYHEHCGPHVDDHLGYRDTAAVDRRKANDLIQNLTPSADMLKRISEAFRLAELAPPPQWVSPYAN